MGAWFIDTIYKFLENMSIFCWTHPPVSDPLLWTYPQDTPRQFKTTPHFKSVSLSLFTKLVMPFKIVFMDVRDKTLGRCGVLL